MSQQGFTAIQRLERNSILTADLVANRGNRKFAIECKVVRPEKLPEDDYFVSRPISAWWLDEFVRLAAPRINGAIKQLDVTCKEQQCEYKMPIIDIRRTLRALMSRSDYMEALTQLKDRFPEVDYIGCKAYDDNGDYRSSSLLIYPELRR